MKYKASFICRLCGEKFFTKHETDDPKHAANAIREISSGAIYAHGIGAMELTTFHYCENGSVGVADMTGFELEEDEE